MPITHARHRPFFGPPTSVVSARCQLLETQSRHKALDLLREEHRAIKTMLAALEAAASRLEAGWSVQPALFARAIDFFKSFVDGCHRLKEESALFPLLATRGLGPEISVVAALLAQHEALWAYLRNIDTAVKRMAAGDDGGREPLIASVRAYASLLYEHIRIEDEYFYPLAERCFSAADDQALADEFERAEQTCVRPRERDRCAKTIADFENLVATWWKGPG